MAVRSSLVSMQSWLMERLSASFPSLPALTLPLLRFVDTTLDGISVVSPANQLRRSSIATVRHGS